MSPLKESGMSMAVRARPLLLFVLLTALLGSACARHVEKSPSDAMDDTAVASSGPSVGRGGSLFVKNCAACHGSAVSPGPIGPWLHGIRKRKDLEAVEAAIKHPDPPMPKLFPGTLSTQDVTDIAAYVETL